MKSAQKLLGAPTIGMGSAWAGASGGGNGTKNGRSPAPFFAQKYFIRYTPKMFFQEYINFEIFCYLRRSGVIPV